MYFSSSAIVCTKYLVYIGISGCWIRNIGTLHLIRFLAQFMEYLPSGGINK
jgi:hypothetical protein